MRLLGGLLIASVVNLALFGLLEEMLREKVLLNVNGPIVERVTFIRFKHKTEPPPKNEPEQEPVNTQPPPVKPKDLVQTIEARPLDKVTWHMPEIDMPLNMTSGPYLGIEPNMSTNLVVEPVPKMRFPPRYPQRALMRHVEGKVVLEFTINPDGSVSDARVVKAEPPGYFEQSALRAISRWRFHPKVVAGKAISRTATQTIKYHMK
jgi:protein TonB